MRFLGNNKPVITLKNLNIISISLQRVATKTRTHSFFFP